MNKFVLKIYMKKFINWVWSDLVYICIKCYKLLLRGNIRIIIVDKRELLFYRYIWNFFIVKLDF